MSLTEYRRKRDFSRTSELDASSPAGTGRSRFVIQKHQASHLHFDFRLEIGGSLISWAVPKGVPLKHGEKRLAVKVEDHPVSYLNFEGTIPAEQYGGGTVMVWDHGTFKPLGNNPGHDLQRGKLHVVVKGRKLPENGILSN